jgi:hypothetical protein
MLGGIILGTLAGLFSWSGRPFEPVDVLLTSIGVAGIAGIVSMFVPVRECRVTAEIDRRLKLGGAYVTALESMSVDDAICRLLVRRAAGVVVTVSHGDGVPIRLPLVSLVLPFLAFLAIGTGQSSTGHEAVLGMESFPLSPEIRQVSDELQRAAAELLSTRQTSRGDSVETARRILEIDSQLRDKEIEPAQARSAMMKLLQELPAHRASGKDEGSAVAPGSLAGRMSDLIARVPAESGAGPEAGEREGAQFAQETPSPGQGAGFGTASLEFEQRSADMIRLGAGERQSTWTLPHRRARSLAQAQLEGAGETEGSQAFFWKTSRDTGRPVLPGPPLTRDEATVVDRFLAMLDEETEGEAADQRGESVPSPTDGGR